MFRMDAHIAAAFKANKAAGVHDKERAVAKERFQVRGGGRGARTRVGGERRAADDEYNLDQPPETLCGSTISLTEANERRGPPWARPPLPACTKSRGCFFALFLYLAYGG